MQRILALLIAIAALGMSAWDALSTPPPAQAASAVRECYAGQLKRYGSVVVKAQGDVTCRQARRIVRAHDRRRALPRGWRCAPAGDERLSFACNRLALRGHGFGDVVYALGD